MKTKELLKNATDRPWDLFENKKEKFCIKSPQKFSIVNLKHAGRVSDLKLICKAVNNFEPMLEALKLALEYIEEVELTHCENDTEDFKAGLGDPVRAAIKQAEGRP